LAGLHVVVERPAERSRAHRNSGSAQDSPTARLMTTNAQAWRMPRSRASRKRKIQNTADEIRTSAPAGAGAVEPLHAVELGREAHLYALGEEPARATSEVVRAVDDVP